MPRSTDQSLPIQITCSTPFNMRVQGHLVKVFLPWATVALEKEMVIHDCQFGDAVRSVNNGLR